MAGTMHLTPLERLVYELTDDQWEGEVEYVAFCYLDLTDLDFNEAATVWAKLKAEGELNEGRFRLRDLCKQWLVEEDSNGNLFFTSSKEDRVHELWLDLRRRYSLWLDAADAS